MRSLHVLAFAAIAGCAAMPSAGDREALTKFHRDPASDQRFLYVAAAPFTYPPEDARAEKVRMDWLQTWLELNGVCGRGFVVASREQFRSKSDQDAVRIAYRVRCAE